MTRLSITAAQAKLLALIEAEIAAGRPVPSYDEMAASMDLKSRSGIHRLVTGLEERGRIVRLPNRARSIALLPEPAPPAPPAPREPPPAHRLGLSKPVAEQLMAYCDRRRVAARDVMSAALLAYFAGHP